jgi:opacity protein-like surface antigen
LLSNQVGSRGAPKTSGRKSGRGNLEVSMRHRVAFRRLFSHHGGATLRALAAVLTLALAAQPALAAPSSPHDDPEPQAQQSQGTTGGFAFGAPSGFFTIKGGLYLPRAQSDIYEFNEEQLTLDSGSFNSGLFGMDFGWSANERVDLVFGFEYSSASPVSEFRDFVDEFNVPITQQTRLRQVPISASVRVNLLERGRAVGNYAWVPTTVVPYVGGGAGIVWWRYEQFGDFVDFNDFTIFTDHFLTEGWDPELHVFGGVDVALSPVIALNFETRYGWAEGEMAPAFVGFEPIDLAGFRATFGASFRF